MPQHNTFAQYSYLLVIIGRQLHLTINEEDYEAITKLARYQEFLQKDMSELMTHVIRLDSYNWNHPEERKLALQGIASVMSRYGHTMHIKK